MKSKLHGGNLVQGVNTWVVSLLRYSAAFGSWRKCELQSIDRKTRKLFTIYGGLHPEFDVDILYIPRKNGGKGLIAIEDCVELAVRGLEVYVHESQEILIQAAGRYKLNGVEAASVLKKARKEKRLQDCEEKTLHGQYLRQTKEIRRDMIVAAQNQSIRTNVVKAKIDKSQKNRLCRLCKKTDESKDHVVSGCS